MNDNELLASDIHRMVFAYELRQIDSSYNNCEWLLESTARNPEIRDLLNLGGVGSQERMRIDSNGNIGIGTVSPRTQLSVKPPVFSGGFSIAGPTTSTPTPLTISTPVTTTTIMMPVVPLVVHPMSVLPLFDDKPSSAELAYEILKTTTTENVESKIVELQLRGLL